MTERKRDCVGGQLRLSMFVLGRGGGRERGEVCTGKAQHTKAKPPRAESDQRHGWFDLYRPESQGPLDRATS